MSHRFVAKYVDHVDHCLQMRGGPQFYRGFWQTGRTFALLAQICRDYCKKNC